jgi:acylphosphatase/peptidoglycan hydrolase CwlO-like protein
MKRLIATVAGQVQKVGYRRRVMQIAKAFGLKGFVENLDDGRVRIIVEGEDEKLKWFESAIDIKNTLIQVSTIEKTYSSAGGEFIRFGKMVDEGETDSRLDKGVEAIGSMIQAINGVTKAIEKMDFNLSSKIDNIGEKIDVMSGKIDTIGEKIDVMSGKIDRIDVKMGSMLQKQDDLIVEVKDMNASLNEKMDRVLDKTDVFELKNDMSDVKTALRAKGII